MKRRNWLFSAKYDRDTLLGLFKIYCAHEHADKAEGIENDSLCPSCRVSLDYSLERTLTCKLKGSGQLCSSCPVHCFEPDQRENIRKIMRFSGPRLIWKSPLLAIRYVLLKLLFRV